MHAIMEGGSFVIFASLLISPWLLFAQAKPFVALYDVYTGPSFCSSVGAVVAADPVDCHAFHQCPGTPAIPAFRRSCGYLLFNPATLTCDWPEEVVKVRPECSKTFSVFGAGDVGGGTYNAINTDNRNKKRRRNKKRNKRPLFVPHGEASGKSPKSMFKGEEEESNYEGEKRGKGMREGQPRFDDEVRLPPTVAATTANPTPLRPPARTSEDRDQVYFPTERPAVGPVEEEDYDEKLPGLFAGDGEKGEEVMSGERKEEEEQRTQTSEGETGEEEEATFPFSSSSAPPLSVVTSDIDTDGTTTFSTGNDANQVDFSMGEKEVTTTIKLRPAEDSLLSVILGLDDQFSKGRPRKLDGEEEEENSVTPYPVRESQEETVEAGPVPSLDGDYVYYDEDNNFVVSVEQKQEEDDFFPSADDNFANAQQDNNNEGTRFPYPVNDEDEKGEGSSSTTSTERSFVYDPFFPFEELPQPLVPQTKGARKTEDEGSLNREDIQRAVDRLYGNYDDEEEPVTVDVLKSSNDDYDYNDEKDIPYSVHAKPPPPADNGNLPEKTSAVRFPTILNQQSFFANDEGGNDGSIFSKLASIANEFDDDNDDDENVVLDLEFQQGLVEHPRFIFLGQEKEEEEDGRLKYETAKGEGRRRGSSSSSQNEDVGGDKEEFWRSSSSSGEERDGPSTFFPTFERGYFPMREKKEGNEGVAVVSESPSPAAAVRDCLDSYFACLQGGDEDGCGGMLKACGDGVYVLEMPNVVV